MTRTAPLVSCYSQSDYSGTKWVCSSILKKEYPVSSSARPNEQRSSGSWRDRHRPCARKSSTVPVFCSRPSRAPRGTRLCWVDEKLADAAVEVRADRPRPGAAQAPLRRGGLGGGPEPACSRPPRVPPRAGWGAGGGPAGRAGPRRAASRRAGGLLSGARGSAGRQAGATGDRGGGLLPETLRRTLKKAPSRRT